MEKNKGGRPKKEKKGIGTSITLEPEYYNLIEETAVKQNSSKSQVIQEAVAEYFSSKVEKRNIGITIFLTDQEHKKLLEKFSSANISDAIRENILKFCGN